MNDAMTNETPTAEQRAPRGPWVTPTLTRVRAGEAEIGVASSNEAQINFGS